MPVIAVDSLRNLCIKVLMKLGVPEESAFIVADSLVKADLRGVESHGVVRFPAYVERIRRGLINLKPSPKIIREGVSYALIDGDNGLGPVVAVRAMDLAIEKAKKAGCSVVAVFNTNYIGMLAYYALRAVPYRMIGMITCNTPPFVAPPGGREARIGTNPICFAIPTGKEFPIVLDMAISPPVGKIRLALKKGEKIPEGWALDSEGRPTTDPAEALKGVLLPVGSSKGFGLGLVVEVLSGVLSGANYSMRITHPLLDMEHTPNLGNFIMVVNVEGFIPFSKSIKRVDKLVNYIKSCKKVEASLKL